MRKAGVSAKSRTQSDVGAPAGEPLSRRERKKLATRKALIQTAKRLFAKQGFDGTTLEQICNAVDIDVTTFFKYFSSKEELVFARMLDTLEVLRVEMAEKPADVSVVEFWWAFLERLNPQERDEETASIIKLDVMPALRGRYGIIVLEYQKILADALAREAGTDPETDIYAQLQANVLMALQITASRQQVLAGGAEVSARTTIAKRVMETFPTREELAPQVRALATPAAATRRPRRGRAAP